jgi:hypothetical protein
MLIQQRGNVVFWVLSVILVVVLAVFLIIPSKFNLDADKNLNDCTTYMKNIWVAANDYVIDTQKDFQGDLNILRTTKKPSGRSFYLEEEKYCPESQGEKTPYIVFGKHVTETLEGQLRHYSGIIILCPNLERFGSHFLDKAFYDNMSTSKLQNVMVNDMTKISEYTKSDSKLKAEYMNIYLNWWKNTKQIDFNACIEDPDYKNMREKVTGEIPSQDSLFSPPVNPPDSN